MTGLFTNLIHFISVSLSDWGSIHPLVVHFPIVLLFFSPLFVLIGMLLRKSTRIFYVCASLLMILGTAGIFLAASTGNTAAEPLQINPETVATLSEHIELAEHARVVFSLLTFIFALNTLFFPSLSKSCHRSAYLSGMSVFLIFYLYALLVLFNAAHYGGKLVHHHKITSNFFNHQPKDSPPKN
ncbi:MAG: DUF2231 domain-containing protein [Candidatus Omnitrophota bacterium]